MKPIKNRFFCRDCGRIKMLFQTEKQANTFIRYNADEINEESGVKPIRSYYCISCDGYHVTSKNKIADLKSFTETVLEDYKKGNENSSHHQAKNTKGELIEKSKNSIQKIENVYRETKAIRNSLKKEFKAIESNIKWLMTLNKFEGIDNYSDTLNLSISRMEVVKTILKELESKYKNILSQSEMVLFLAFMVSKKQTIENALNLLKHQLSKHRQ